MDSNIDLGHRKEQSARFTGITRLLFPRLVLRLPFRPCAHALPTLHEIARRRSGGAVYARTPALLLRPRRVRNGLKHALLAPAAS